MYSFLIIDDDHAARQALQLQLTSACADMVSFCCEDTQQARQHLNDNPIDAIFLDIDLPGVSGFGFLDSLLAEKASLPPIVFTTGHAQFALKAFDYPVLDYLIKPLQTPQVKRALAKVEHWYLRRDAASVTNTSSQVHAPQPAAKVQFRNGSSWLNLLVADIFWIEAAGDYMCIHARDNNHIIRATLKALEQQLCSHHFVRINRSSLVNLQHVTSCQPNANGSYQLRLSDQQTLRVSRKYKMLIDEANEALLAIN